MERRQLSFLIVALSSGWVMVYADRLSISPLLNQIRSEFGLNFAAVSLVVSIYFVTYGFSAIPSTAIAERVGYKKTLLGCMSLAAVGLAAAGLAGYTYSLLLLLIAIHGAGAGALYPTGYKLSTEYVPQKSRGLSSALINSGMGFGTILGLVIAGPILAYFSNWQVVLVILSVPTAFVVLLLHRWVPEGANKSGSGRLNLRNYWLVLRSRSYLAINGAMFCSLYGYWVILTWGPTFLQESQKLSIFYSGLTTAIFAAVAIPSSILVARHSDRTGRRKIGLITLPLAALAIFLMAYSTGIAEFIAATVLYGVVGKLTFDPVAIAWIGDTVPPELSGSAFAMLNVVAMSSSIIAPILTGTLADFTGTLSSGFYLGAVVVLFGCAFLLLGRPRTTLT